MCFKEALGNATDILKEYYDSMDIVLVAHVLGPRGHDNMMQLNCSETEHFTLQEFDEIYKGIVNAGFFIRKVFFSELDFIKDIVAESPKYSKTTVFNLCRNGTGMNKKTLVPAICDLLNVAYTSPSAGSCVLARNKSLFTSYLSAEGILCPISGHKIDDLIDRLSLTSMVICKPNTGSASQDISEKSIMPLANISCSSNANYLIQEYIDGYECEVPIFCNSAQCFAMPPVGISFASNAHTGILSYIDSLNNNYDFYNFSDILNNEICEKIMHDAEKIFNLLNLETYGRVDFKIDKKTHRHYLIDISTTPYITRHSSFSFTVAASGGTYSDIYRLIVAASLYRNQGSQGKKLKI
jgi:D-alanine-D-alanine ligase